MSAVTATDITVEHITFRNADMLWDIAADIYLPAGFDAAGSYPAVVTAHPIGSCKEQTAGNIYATRLAEEGYVAIAFDASFQGASGGTPRRIEDPGQRVEDFRRVVDHLVTLPYVDADRIGVLGVCGGGGYTVNAALTEKRFKAVVSVTGVNYGRLSRDNAALAGGPLALLGTIAQQRSAESKGADAAISASLPPSAEVAQQIGDVDVIEAFDYYCTPRAQHPEGTATFDVAHGAATLGWDAYHLADVLLDQPTLAIVGDKQGAFGAYRDGHDLVARAGRDNVRLVVLEDVSHYDLYDQPKGAGKALDEHIVPFFATNL
ncbi:alpha/beta hydrolase [Microbacterium sp. No. 7]|uniref:alpha/beta hydrolase n=1 Tax=Microbacterium sp. No. 7 TaxID=1714373 RepID=UPI0006ED29D4|nr:alpha/beta hydrolase [Microbacterium sp. No. 7]ALJ21632.1 alpha/beta hydrolase [Microbacterium sp. No. 7]